MVFESDRLCHTGCERAILNLFSWIRSFEKKIMQASGAYSLQKVGKHR